jgi:cell shape-determining protein MreC
MKVHTRLSSKQAKQKRITRVLLGAGVVLLLGLILPFMFTFAGRVIMYPIHVTNDWFRTSPARLPMFLREQDELLDEIKRLENELAIAQSTDLTQRRLFEENLWLRDLLHAKQKDRIAAAVIARPTEIPYDLMQIDKGSDEGVKEGAPVYVGADNVIGIVRSTAPHYAFVELFTTPGFSATAYISGANVMTTLEGYGGGVARVSVPQGVPLTVGNLVYIPSIEPGVFGRVAYVENRPTQPEQYGYITLPQPVAGIRYVAVASDIVAPVQPPEVEARVRQLINDALIVDTKSFNFASTSATSSTATATAGYITTP